MLIDPSRTIVLAFLYGGFKDHQHRQWGTGKPLTADWLKRTFPEENLRGVNHSPYLCARNRAIRDLVLPVADQFDWVLSVDNDVTVTTPGDERFLNTPGDVVACECPMPHEGIWGAADAFHTAFYRARVEVFRTVEPPWFDYVYSDDGCELLDCDCGYFKSKCQAAGFTVTHGGYCSHDCQGSYLKPFGHQPRLAPQFAPLQPAAS